MYHGHVHIAIVQSSSLLFGLYPIPQLPHLPQCFHEALIDDSEEADSSDEIEQSDNKKAEELETLEPEGTYGDDSDTGHETDI